MTLEATRTPVMFGEEILLEPETKHPLAGELQFRITTDSVVATATVTPSEPMRKIFIAWGDGETSSINRRPGIPTSAATVVGDGDGQLPAGTYQLTHRYPEPEDRMPVEYFVILRVSDEDGGEEIDIARIEIIPRYRVTNYRTRVRLTNPADLTGATAEFDIRQTVDGVKQQDWHWEPSNNFFGESQYFVLEGSQVSRELTVADPAVYVSFFFTETDPGPDTHGTYTIPLRATDDSDRVSLEVEGRGGVLGFATFQLIATYDREVSLIAPLPDSGHQVVFA
jgi:hypothetical protein